MKREIKYEEESRSTTKGRKLVFRRNIHIFLLVVLLFVCFFTLNYIRNWISNLEVQYDKKRKKTTLTTCLHTCPNRLQPNGEWIRGKGDLKWKYESVEKIRESLHLPRDMTRKDFRCGVNYPIAGTRTASHCNAKDDQLKCCAESSGWCGNTNDHCNDPVSFNVNNKLAQQNAVWENKDSNCSLQLFNQQQACAVLEKGVKKIVFIGDSQAMHLFMAFILLVTGNYKDGGIKNEYKNIKEKKCLYEYQLLNRECRTYLINSSKQLDRFCDGGETIELEYFQDYQSFASIKTLSKIKSLAMVKNTFIVLGAGIHFNSDHRSFTNYYLKDVVQEIHAQTWPKLIIETLPSVYSKISTERRKTFNDQLKKYTRDGIAVLDNFYLTDKLESFNGKTYGLNFNTLKVHLLLNYFSDLQRCETES